jgi:hypothetical protein
MGRKNAFFVYPLKKWLKFLLKLFISQSKKNGIILFYYQKMEVYSNKTKISFTRFFWLRSLLESQEKYDNKCIKQKDEDKNMAKIDHSSIIILKKKLMRFIQFLKILYKNFFFF